MNKKIKLMVIILVIVSSISLDLFSNKIVKASNHLGQIASEKGGVFILRNTGELFSMGYNANGKLGINTNTTTNQLEQVKGTNGIGYLTNIKDISISAYFGLALKNDGTVWSWGINNKGQLGDNTLIEKWAPVQVKGAGGVGVLTDIIQIKAGFNHSVALKSDGTVWSWGNNNRGQLGDNTISNKFTPIQMKDPSGLSFLTGITQISAGNENTFLLKNDGTVFSLGDNSFGKLGDGTEINKKLPVQVKDETGTGVLTNVNTVESGENMTLVSKNDGTVWSWGYNLLGQLGNGTTINSSLPVQVLGTDGIGFLTDVKQISNGNQVSSALMNDGTVRSWGYAFFGQLGINTQADESIQVPQKVFGINGVGYLSDVSYIYAGDGDTFAVQRNGDILGWGKNGFSTLLSNSIGKILVPTKATITNLAPIYKTTTSLTVNAGLLSINDFINHISFEDYQLNIQDASTTMKTPYAISVEDFTGSWSGWHLNFKIDEFLNNAKPLINSSLIISCDNARVFDSDETGAKTGIGSIIQNEFTCNEGNIPFQSSFPLISADDVVDTSVKHIFEFPNDFLTLSYSNQSQAGNYVAQITFELITGP